MDNFVGMPNWLYEWAVVVGDYYHTLGGDHASKNVYENGRREKKYERHLIGTTLFNDWAIKEAAESVIKSDVSPYYRLEDNNGEAFALRLMDKICPDTEERREPDMSKGTYFVIDLDEEPVQVLPR